MNTKRKYGCAVLAGGAGSRMGHVNKAELEYEGKTFAEAIMSEMEKMALPCYCSIANYKLDVPAGWKAVRDIVTGADRGFIGPMGGIYSCLLQAREDGLEGLFFAPCDAPLYSAAVSEKLASHIERGTDAAIWKTGDGRLQTTFGWYSVDCIPAMEEDIAIEGYKLAGTLKKIRTVTVDTAAEGISDEIFRNINRPEEHDKLLSGQRRRHILICGDRQVGKSTLIENCIKDLKVPVYGYRTRIYRDDPDGISRTYIYPAAGGGDHRGEDNYIGSTKGRLLDVRTENFEKLGTSLLREARPDGIIVMDEVGFMESGAPLFRKAVIDALDGDIHVIAAVRKSDKHNEHIEAVRDHPNAELIMLTEANRDKAAAKLKSIVAGWEQDILAGKGGTHE